MISQKIGPTSVKFMEAPQLEGVLCTPSNTAFTEAPPFRFGLIADVQYSTRPDTPAHITQMDFAPSPSPVPGAPWPLVADAPCQRRFSASLGILQQAVAAFAAARCPLAMVLGDVLDKSAAARGEVPQCLAAIAAALAGGGAALQCHFTFGNNDAAAVGRAGWVQHFAPHCTPEALYHSFSPRPGFRFIVLDAYCESTLCPAEGGEARARELTDMLHAANPLAYPRGAAQQFPPEGAWPLPWAALPRERMHLMHYNGGLGGRQLAWLEAQLGAATAAGQRVFVFSHLPIEPLTCRPDGLAWDHAETRALLERFGCVQAHIAGHDHAGGYHCGAAGLHCLVPPAPLECAEGEVAYGVVALGEGGWELEWHGKEPRAGGATLQGGAWPKGVRMPYRGGGGAGGAGGSQGAGAGAGVQ